MTDRPILFSSPMVRALLDGRKTMTRRLAWRRCKNPQRLPQNAVARRFSKTGCAGMYWEAPTLWQKVEPGDRLWCREGHGIVSWPPWDAPYCIYRTADPSPQEAPVKWRPSIHMPRWASRLTLIVTATRIERLQDISGTEAFEEGCNYRGSDGELHHAGDHPSYSVLSFKFLWDSLHGEGTYDANPEVVALSFTVNKCNIDAMERAA